MTRYFDSCPTLDALKAAYKAAALAHHPDLGEDTATMQAINAECLTVKLCGRSRCMRARGPYTGYYA